MKIMTQEDKQLLLKDLCARLPYGNIEVKVTEPTNDIMDEVFVGKHICSTIDIEDFILGRFIVKPYLRPMSSMTEEERKEHGFYCGYKPYDEHIGESYLTEYDMPDYIDWLLEHHFDYRGLIPMGLALEATEGMYKTE